MAETKLWEDLVAWAKHAGMKTDPDGLLVELRFTENNGRGLFLTKDVAPSTALFSLPQEMLLNFRTLESHYPTLYLQNDFEGKSSETLTATQLLIMHLFLHRPGHRPADSHFGPYLAILPRSFDSHPVTWVMKHMDYQNHSLLLDIIPPGTSLALQKVAQAIEQDWITIMGTLHRHPEYRLRTRWSTPAFAIDLARDSEQLDCFLWAWLNVNSRSVYHRLCSEQSDPNNLSLCPILDLANHHPNPLRATSSNPLPTFRSPPSLWLKQGEEVFLRYGHHSNSFLFIHYGFVCTGPDMEQTISVDDVVEELLRERIPLTRNAMEKLLVTYGYWKEWNLHSSPPPAHSSYRLLPALRLLDLSDEELALGPKSKRVSMWIQQVMGSLSWELGSDSCSAPGEIDGINLKWEASMQKMLIEVCERVIARTTVGLDRLERTSGMISNVVSMSYPLWCIGVLWEEERAVASAVKKSVLDGNAMW